MGGIFDIRAQLEEKKLEHLKEVEQKQKELRQAQIEDLRHKENTMLSKIAIVVSVIALIVALFK